MKVVILVAMLAAGYLSGSLSWAIIVTKLATGKDIRELGNRNAGTSNVKRSVGIQYAIIVFFLDVAKAVVPMYLVRTFLFPGDGYLDVLAVFGVGMGAIAGHCRPLYFGFRGGGGITSSLGVFLFFAPLEFLLTLCVACAVVFFFIRNVQRRLTQWLPISFVTLAPLVLLAANLTLEIRLSERLTFGGHPWPVVVGTRKGTGDLAQCTTRKMIPPRNTAKAAPGTTTPSTNRRPSPALAPTAASKARPTTATRDINAPMRPTPPSSRPLGASRCAASALRHLLRVLLTAFAPLGDPFHNSDRLGANLP